MFANDMNGAGVVREPIADRLPRLAVVCRHEHVDAEIVAAMAVECRVGRSFFESGCDDAADVRSLLWRHVLPALATIAGDLQVAVVGAGIEKIAIQWRLTDRRNLRPSLDTVVARHRLLIG